MTEWFTDLLVEYGLSEGLAGIAALTTALVALVLAAWLADLIVQRVLLRAVRFVVAASETDWDDVLLRRRTFHRAAHFAPATLFYLAAPVLGAGQVWAERLAIVYMIGAVLRVCDSLFDSGIEIYQRSEVSREKPMRGYVQVVQIFLYLVGGIFMLSTLLDKQPWGLLTGLGAMSAVLLLVFRDSILGFVASIQLASNNMISRGDWIEMPSYGADGDVIDISLHTVKVQNWDKTITTIPTYALISNSFKNWRGMSESNGRRIKRSVNIDLGTIRFCDDEMLERFAKIEYLGEYLDEKRSELSRHNEAIEVDLDELANGRRLTNVGTFRAYVERYLRAHPKIHMGMTFLVRQLAPDEKGLPIEIYVFSNDQDWGNYEAIQADIFDHILAAIPQFDLRVYQSPSGHDLVLAGRAVGASGAH
ncbi:MAG: mechanosensitive ion channel [bacterium]|nr:mechanosensitive ion channel [bacterium]